MDLSIYSGRDLQNMLAILNGAGYRVDLSTVAAMIGQELAARQVDMVGSPRPAALRRPDNITTCPVCGAPAVIVPLARADRSATATHAIQCQNRPATDQPWRDGMCGHTEYIVRGER